MPRSPETTRTRPANRCNLNRRRGVSENRTIMRKVSLLVYGVCLATCLNIGFAQDAKPEKKKKGPPLTEEQKQLRKDLLAKYDTNKDGKIDRDERKSVSSEDKDKMKKAGLTPPRKPKDTPADHTGDKASSSSGSTGSASSTSGTTGKTE